MLRTIHSLGLVVSLDGDSFCLLFKKSVMGNIDKESRNEDFPKKDKDNKKWWMFWR